MRGKGVVTLRASPGARRRLMLGSGSPQGRLFSGRVRALVGARPLPHDPAPNPTPPAPPEDVEPARDRRQARGGQRLREGAGEPTDGRRVAERAGPGSPHEGCRVNRPEPPSPPDCLEHCPQGHDDPQEEGDPPWRRAGRQLPPNTQAPAHREASRLWIDSRPMRHREGLAPGLGLGPPSSSL